MRHAEVIMSEEKSRFAAGNILSELLKKPGFKDDVRDALKSIDPDAGRELVRTFLWQDLEFSLGLMGGLPAIANTFIRAIDELLIEINEKYPMELLKGFADSLIKDTDTESLGRALRNARPYIDALGPIFKKAWQDARDGERT
jgi:hypothetical protein